MRKLKPGTPIFMEITLNNIILLSETSFHTFFRINEEIKLSQPVV